ncbi:MAG TPA: hypothetical protein PLI95_15935 [Polyangiaceae bacterium]|nr:hypothetical protein [Polyangiaceae bacterium]
MRHYPPGALLLAMLLTACGNGVDTDRACTTMGCANGFVVNLQSDAWSAGAYQIAIVADDRTIVCTAALPLPKTGPQSACDAAGVTLGTSGSELEPTEQSLYEVRFSDTYPKTVTMTVSRDATKLAEQSFTPEYATLQPNGPDCEPTCKYASATLAW